MNDHILIEVPRDPLFGYTKESLIQALLEKLTGRVTDAFIFGSFFSENFSKDSDIDIILIKNTKTPFTERTSEFFDLLDMGPTMDILVYTPEEFANLMNEKCGFWKSVKSSLVKIL